jgi:translation initiation factor 4E
MDEKIQDDSSQHPLNSQWVVWYHNPSDQSWTSDSYKDILELHSIEDYLVLKNSWKTCLPEVSEGMYYMMRKTDKGIPIFPMWEDENNKNGGVWSFKITKEEADDVWFKLCTYMIGENICENVDICKYINGISISPKKNFCIVKIWNSDYMLSDTKLLSSSITFLNLNEVLYSSHQNNIERDHVKIQNRIKRWEAKETRFRKF